jgi:tetratricopeptide (TPR) repeat protein
MTFILRILTLILIVEVLGGFYYSYQTLYRVEPQLPELDQGDPIVVRDLHHLQNQARYGSSDDWRKYGEILLGQGYYSYAELAFRRCLDLDAHDLPALFALAFCLDRTGQIKESTAIYERYIQLVGELHPAESNIQFAQYGVGRNYLREENYEAALTAFKDVQKFPASEYQVAKLLIRAGKPEAAMPLLEKNLEALPLSLDFHYLAMLAMHELHRPDQEFESAQMMERSAHLVSMSYNTNYVKFYRDLTGIEQLAEETNANIEKLSYDQAEKKLLGLLQMMPDPNHMYYKRVAESLITVYMLQKRPQEMQKWIDILHQNDYETPDLLLQQSRVYLLLGNFDKAVELWKRVLLIAPSPEVHTMLATYYRQQQQLELANLHDSEKLLLDGIKLYRSNKLTESEKTLQQSIKLNPNNAQTWFYLGEIDKYLQKPAEAIAAYEKCLSLQPYYGRAIRQLKRLKKS